MSEQELANDFNMQSKEYDNEKFRKKQLLVRSVFQSIGKYSGKAIKNRDYFHGGDKHLFPHDHIWDWSKNPPRQKA